jgi:hypothetical protein
MFVCCAACPAKQDRKRTYVMGYLDLPRSSSSSSGGSSTEVCFKLERLRNTTAAAATQGVTTLSTPPAGWYFYLANLRFVLQEGNTSTAGTSHDLAADEGMFETDDTFEDFDDVSDQELASIRKAVPTGVPLEAATAVGKEARQLQPTRYEHLAASKDMLDLERRMRKAARPAGVPAVAAAAAAAGKREAGIASKNNSSSSSSSVERVWKQLQQQHEWPDGQVVFESLYSTCNMEDMEECAEMCNNL